MSTIEGRLHVPVISLRKANEREIRKYEKVKNAKRAD